MKNRLTKLITINMMVLCMLIGFSFQAASQINVALTATATHSGGGVTGYGPQLYNDGNIPQPCSVTGTNMWGWVSTNGWIEFTWTTPQTFDKVVLHKANRPMTTCTFEYWNGSTYVSFFNYNSSVTCEDSVTFLPVTTTKFRMNGVAGSSNPNHREIQVIQSSNAHNDAGVASIDSPYAFCPGTFNIRATVRNYGKNIIDSVKVNWTFDGIAQTPYNITTPLDTTGGTGPISIQVLLGTKTFAAGISHPVKAWTSNPNGQADTSNYNDTATTSLKPALSGTFTIGGATPDYANFTAAVNDIKANGICGPVVFNVAVGSGPYVEQIEIPEIVGSSAVNTITFNGNGETIQFTSTNSAEQAVIRLNGADYVTIDNLVIKPLVGSYGWGIQFTNQANYNTITNCVIDIPLTSTSSNFVGIVATGSNTSVATTGNNANHNIISRNTINGGYYGIRWNGISGTESDGNQFTNNNIQDFYYYGMYIYYTKNTSIIGNDINRLTRQLVTTMYGMYLYFSSDITVEKNRIHDSHTGATSNANTVYGMYLYQCNGTNGNYSRIVNNLFYNLNNNSTLYCLYHNLNDMIQYYHNSVILDYQFSTTGTIRGLYLTGAGSNIDFRNNIVHVTKSGTGTKHGLYLNTPIQSDNNVVYVSPATGSNYTGYFGGNFSTFANWQTANGGAFDQNSVGVDPLYLAPGSADYTPTNPLVDNVGAPVNVADDILGNARCAKPDPGAFENKLVLPPLDAGIASVDSPTTFCAGIQPIAVTVQNYGSNIINSVTVNWTLNGVMQTPYSLVTPLDTSCGFGNSSAMVTLGTNNFLNGVAYTIKVWTSNPNGGADTSNLNDTLIVVKQAALGGTFTIGGSNPSYANFTDAVTALNSFGVCSAVIFNVRPGTYLERLDLMKIDGASSVNTITFQAQNGDSNSVVLTQEALLLTDNYTVRFNGAEHVTFRKMTIQATNATYGRVVEFFSGANHNMVNNCRIVGVEVVTTSNYHALFYNYTGLEEYNTIRNNRLFGGAYGIYNYGVSTTSMEKGNVIEGNIMKPYYMGIYNYYQSGTVIRNNRIELTYPTTGYGIYSYYTYGAIVYTGNQIILPNGGYGVYMGYNVGSATERGLFANNMISIGGATTAYGMYLIGTTSHKDIIHNSIHIHSTSTTAGRGIYGTSTGTSMNFLNNIFANTGGGYSVYFTNTTGIDSSDYNDHYSSGFILAYWAGNQFDLAGLQTISSKEANSISINPYFVSATDLHSGPTVNNQGMPHYLVSDDFDGETRSLTTPDIGADEFTPPPFDMTILTALNPSSACGLSDIEPLTVIAMNFGTDTMQIGDTIIFSYSINGGPHVNEMHILTSPLGFLDSITFNFASVLDLSVPKDYNITIWPTTTGDFNYKNDTLYYFVVSIPNVITYPYVENFENGTGGWSVNGTTTTWELGTPAGTQVYQAASGDYAWMTNLDGNYSNNENGYVLGPCFDFTNLNKPQVSISINWNTEFSWDGAVFQSSTDSGLTWLNVGALNDDINWYNDNTINGNPGGQQVGWSGNGTSGSLGWISAKHALDGLAGENDVLFRMAFGSDPSVNNYDGFAFDDVVIGETPIINIPDTVHTCGWVVLDIGIPNGVYQWSTGQTTQSIFMLADSITKTHNIDIYAENMYGLYTEKKVVLILDPGPYVDLGNDTLVCGNTVLILDAGNPQMNYNWSTSESTQTINVSQNGLYFVEVMHNNGCTHGDSIVVNFEAFPIAVFTYTDTNTNTFVNFNSAGSYGSSYIWNFGDGNGAYIENPKHYFTKQGTYTVSLITENECGIDTFTQVITVVHVGIGDPTAFNEVSVYPNPSDGLFNVEISTLKPQDIQLSLLNVQGQLIYSEMLVDVLNTNTTVNLSALAKGIYYLKLQAGTDVMVKKLIIQ